MATSSHFQNTGHALPHCPHCGASVHRIWGPPRDPWLRLLVSVYRFQCDVCPWSGLLRFSYS
jgi:hypothetical protein